MYYFSVFLCVHIWVRSRSELWNVKYWSGHTVKHLLFSYMYSYLCCMNFDMIIVL